MGRVVAAAVSCRVRESSAHRKLSVSCVSAVVWVEWGLGLVSEGGTG